MTDFNIQISIHCKRNSYLETSVGGYTQIFGGEGTWPSCSCHAYKYHKNGTTIFNGRKVSNLCKHIYEAEKQRCGWHKMFSDEIQEIDGVCPKCGGATEYIKVAV